MIIRIDEWRKPLAFLVKQKTSDAQSQMTETIQEIRANKNTLESFERPTAGVEKALQEMVI